jgi:hypothetical protein
MLVLLLVAGLAAPAAAVPVTVFFDEDSGFGVSEESAEASGVPLVSPSFVGSASGVLNVVSQELQGDNDSIVSQLLAQSGNSATSLWTVENESDTYLPEDTYFLFVTSVPFGIDGEVVEYDDENVGLTIDPESGWVIVRACTEDGECYYYPAVLLGSLEPGETADPFAVNYVIDESVHQTASNKVVLPQFFAAMAIAPIPEPTAGVLMGVGLALLAVVLRRR